jgi:lysophospholipase L1-like esterase
MINLKSLLSEQRKTNKKLRVLFIGDSQTAGLNSYARQLISSKIVNGKILAQRGASMSDIFNQFKSEYKPGKYDVISILGGNNDAGSEKFDTTSFNSIISAAGNTPIILITAPTMEYINKVIYPKNYPSMHDIPRWQSSLASKTVRVINAYSLLDNKISIYGYIPVIIKHVFFPDGKIPN